MAVAEQQISPEQPSPADAKAPAAPPRRALPVRVARHTLRHTLRLLALWLLAGTAFAVVFLILVAMMLFDRPVTLPAWVTHRIEAQMNNGLTVGRVSLGSVEVQMDGARAPQVRLKNVGLFDRSGAEVARLNEVGAGFDAAALVRGGLMPDHLRLSGAQITVRRKADGALDLSFGQMGRASGSLPGLLDAIDRLFADGPLTRIASIEASELTITLEDARTARLWQVTDGRLRFTQTARDIEISVAFDVFNGTENLASTTFTFTSDKGTAAARIGASFSNAAAKDIALQSPVLAFLGILDAPISGSLRLAVGADARLTDFAGALEIGAGALTPDPGASPIGIDRGKAYFTYDPGRQRIDFSDLEVESDALAVRLSGQTFLADLGPDGWPQEYVGQFRLVDLVLRDDSRLAAPIRFQDGQAEVKMQLAPFALTVGKLALRDGPSSIVLAGRVAVSAAGPVLALDAGIDRITPARLLGLWPPGALPMTREWLAQNLPAAEFTAVKAAVRTAPGARPQVLLGADFDAATVHYMKAMPPVVAARGYLAIAGDRLTVRAAAGQIAAPQGGRVDIAGSVLTIPDIWLKPAPAVVDLAAKGPITAILSLLDQEPFRVMRKAARPVDLAEGTADLTAHITLPLQHDLQPGDAVYSAGGTLHDVVSDKIVQGRTIAADRLRVATDGATLTIDGSGSFGQLPVRMSYRQPIAPGAAPDGSVDATVALGETFLKEFGIALPDGAVKGQAPAEVRIDLGPGQAPRFRLTSDLGGVALRLDSLAWRKAAGVKGVLELSGSLGTPPVIDALRLDAAGLRAEGRIALKPGGQLAQAEFARVRLDDWLDTRVTLVGRGAGAQPEVRVSGGSLDFRRATFGSDAGSTAAGGPMQVRLDRLTVADGIDLTDFSGDFTTNGGFNGAFTARLNGGGVLRGTLAPRNGGTALRITSDDAGNVLRDADLAQRIRGGVMELILLPTGQKGVYDGTLTARTVRVRGTPALAELLNAVSIIGLLQQLNGDGLVFDTVDARFLLTPNAINFTRASAVGASLGVTAEGSYALADGALDIRGVFSPLYLLNGIGQIFGRKGEGLFGFNYRLTGTSAAPKVAVNPLSILTPGMFRELFRRPPPKPK